MRSDMAPNGMAATTSGLMSVKDVAVDWNVQWLHTTDCEANEECTFQPNELGLHGTDLAQVLRDLSTVIND